MAWASTSFAWRSAALAGLVVGLAMVAPLGVGLDGEGSGGGAGLSGEGSHVGEGTESPAGIGTLAGAGVVAVLAGILAILRPRLGEAGAVPWICLVFVVVALLGLSIGSARLAAIDAGALVVEPGEPLELRGTVASQPRASGEVTRFMLDTPEGRIAVETRSARDASSEVKVAQGATFTSFGVSDEGGEVAVSGTVREPAPWERVMIERSGASRVLVADRIEATGAARGGLRGALDDVRRRAEAALERGTQPVSAALLRGFVLGQDDRIPEDVRDDFRRSGLAHILAVSGQNVMLLAVLATPLLALAGIPIRSRLLAIAVIIAIYVPVAGGGASIQRAGVMGVAGVVAALASRPTARWYALGLAAAVTLAIDPRATSDIGWQLSFAAVAGLLVLAPPLIRILASDGMGLRRAFAEGAAMTLAASLATAPLAAHHFGTVSLTAIPANLIALPAVAPAMWLGMLSGAVGQIPNAPVEPLSWLGGLCAGFIGWVAHLLGTDSAQLDVPEPGPLAALVWTAVLVGGARLGCLALERRSEMRPAPRSSGRLVVWSLAGVVALAAAAVLIGRGRNEPGPRPELAIRILDVGQGDAILVEPQGTPPLLVDTGPPEGEAADRLVELGVDRLFGIAITHDERDHAGALAAILSRIEASRLLSAGDAPSGCRVTACPPSVSLSRGSSFRMGAVRVEALWPPASMAPGENPNETALVLRISYRDFDALLASDAEAEVAAYAPAPVDVLKVAHHGSADAGLDSLLARTSPQMAAISVGAGNPYGHPAPETLGDLGDAAVPLIRTDDAGEILIEVERDGSWSVRAP